MYDIFYIQRLKASRICCANCRKLNDYLKMVTMELKLAQKLIRILREEKVDEINLKNHKNLSSKTHQDIEANLKKLRLKNVCDKT
jgi:hypothetical protein